MNKKNLEYKSVKCNVKVSEEKGIIEAYVSIFGNVDLTGEIIDKGAFADSLKIKLPKGVWSHNWDQPIAKTLEAREDDKGLYIKGKLILEVQKAAEAYALMKEGVIDEFSIGYQVVEDETDKEGNRHLKKIRLYEWSPVLVGANPKTELLNVKSESIDEKGAVPYAKYPLADEKTKWDATGARKRIAKLASSDGSGDKDKIDWAKYRKIFAWFDNKNADTFTGYKLPHHDVIGGKIQTVWKGVAAAMGALLGARGGADVGNDKNAVYSHLVKHYKEFDKPIPEKQADGTYKFFNEEMEAVKETEQEAEKKEGRVLSEKNRFLIKNVIEKMTDLIDPLKELLSATETGKVEGGKKVDAEPKKIFRIKQDAKQIDKTVEHILRIVKSK